MFGLERKGIKLCDIKQFYFRLKKCRIYFKLVKFPIRFINQSVNQSINPNYMSQKTNAALINLYSGASKT